MWAATKRTAARLAAPAGAIIGGAAALRVIYGVAFANYDTLYALAWGGQLARGETPAYGVPIAPTPHPLVELAGLSSTRSGHTPSRRSTVAFGYLALSACGWVIYLLGREWFGRAAGALAALIFLTRVPVISYGVRAYVDLPYLLACWRHCWWRPAGDGRGRRCWRCWRSPGCCARRRGPSPVSTGLPRGGRAPARAATSALPERLAAGGRLRRRAAGRTRPDAARGATGARGARPAGGERPAVVARAATSPSPATPSGR